MTATIARKAARKPAAKPILAQAPNIAENTLKDIEQIAHAAPSAPQEGKLAISMDTFVQAINTANMSYKFAFYMEMAVSLAVFAEAGDTNKDTKKSLYEVYSRCGMDCKDITGADYKTINRRVNAAADLYNFLGKVQVAKWMENTAEMTSLNAIVRNLEKLNLKGINSVLALTGKPVQKALPKAPEVQQSAPSQPQTAQNAPQQTTPTPAGGMADKVSQFIGNEIERARAERNRRQSDVPGALTFSAEGVQVMVSPNASKSALMQVALELLEFANTLNVAEESVAT